MNQNGFSIVSALISVSVISMGALAVAQVSRSSAAIQAQSQSFMSLQFAKNEMAAYLQNDQSWKSMVDDTANTSLQCLRDGTDCCIPNTVGDACEPVGLLAVRNAMDQLVYDTNDPTVGISPAGEVCDEYDSVNYSTRCPYRYEVEWTPVCVPGGPPCINPQLIIKAKLRIPEALQKNEEIGYRYLKNLEQYEFKIVRNPIRSVAVTNHHEETANSRTVSESLLLAEDSIIVISATTSRDYYFPLVRNIVHSVSIDINGINCAIDNDLVFYPGGGTNGTSSAATCIKRLAADPTPYTITVDMGPCTAFSCSNAEASLSFVTYKAP